MDQSTEHPHAENPDTGIAVSAARPRSLTMTESEADIEMQLAPENLDDFSEFEEAIASPSDTSLGRVFTPSTTHNTASSAFLVVAAHPDQSPNNKTANPTSQSDETAETLATPALSHAHFSPPPQDNEHRSLPQNYPPIIYPDIGLPLAQGSQSNSGGKIAAHTQREAMDVDMAGVGRNHCEDTLAEPTTLPSNYPPVIYPALRSPRPDDSRLYLGGETGARVLTRPGRQTEDEVIVIEDEDENESGSEGEYTSSEVSDGQDLKGDLEHALNGDFDFKGNFAFTKTLPSAPNPGLHIEGIGLVGLPLSERDAKLIAGCATQAPFGHGERTVVDTSVRDTFEVEPARVKFINPAWDGYVKNLVTQSIWPELGVGTYTTPPRCELYKLLLYKTGSHFLPHQDTEKVDGMFATVIIVLPSLYSGGDVHVSHGNNRKVFQGGPINAFTTSILAWYTDVMHEVKPIESGYRLALSFNLIHTSPGIPRPTLPDMHSAITRLRHVLRKWSKDAYEVDMDEWQAEIVAYVLEHQYSEVNLKMGALKGKDRHMISNLRGVAEELGFAVCLANLKYVESGSGDHDGGYSYDYGRRRRWYDDSEPSDEEVSDPGMADIDEKTLEINHLVNLDGVKLLPGKPLPLEECNLIPEDYFEGQSPDNHEYEGYQGNAAGTLEYFYHRSVLVLFPKAKEVEVLLNAGGVPFALEKARQADPASRTLVDRQTAQYVINRLGSQDQATKIAMVDLAVNWNDLEMWKEVVKASGAQKSADILGKPKFVDAWKIFSFESICATLELCLTECTSLKTRLELISYLQEQSPEEERHTVVRWCDAQISRAWSCLKSPLKDDVPAFLAGLRLQGPSFFSEVIVTQLVQFKNIYDFWVEFIPAFHKQILESQSAEGTPATEISQANTILDRCLSTAFTEWDSVVEIPKSTWSYIRPSAPQEASIAFGKISRICRLLSLSIQTSRFQLCEPLLVMVLTCKGDLPTLFKTLYMPLIPELRRTLAVARLDMTVYPLSHFSSVLIGSYLQNVLGAKPPRNAPPPQVPKVGCGCADCTALDRFMASAAAMQTFRYGQSRRHHLEHRLHGAQVTYSTDHTGNPHGLVVKKNMTLLPAENWRLHQHEAKKLLGNIGDDHTIAKIMGARQTDVTKALEGAQHFKMAAGDSAARREPITTPSTTNTGANGAPTLPVPISGPQASTSSLAVQPTTLVERAPVAASAPPLHPISTNITATQVVGQKRKTALEVMPARQKRKKTPEVHGDVIDLTGDSP